MRPIRQRQVSFNALAQGGQVLFEFEPLYEAPWQTYYVEAQVDQPSVLVLGRDEEAYPYGSAYIDGLPVISDLAFTTTYRYNWRELLVDMLAWLQNVGMLLPLAGVLWLPGWLLLPAPAPEDDPGERFALAVGLSLSIIPITLTWTSFAGMSWSSTAAMVSVSFLVAIALRRIWQRRSMLRFHLPAPFLILIVLTFFSLMVRLVMIRDLHFPAWVDSVHHGVITRLIQEQGAWPKTYAPLIEIDSASYHAGFHASLALFTWLSRLPSERAMLLYGQVLNALIVPSVYLLTRRLGANPWSGVLAGMLAGLFTPMPAYYTSWGRYTQLAGLLLLPVVYAYLQTCWQRPGWQTALLAGLAGAGLFLVHYRAAAFLATLALCASILWVGNFLISKYKHSKQGEISPPAIHIFLPGVAHLILAIGLGVFFALPWLPGTIFALFLPKLTFWSGGDQRWFDGFSLNLLTSAWGWPALALAALGLGWSLARNRRLAATLILWVAGLLFLANLGALRLPGNAFINNTSVAIMLFIPVSVAGGYFLGDLYTSISTWLPDRFRKIYAQIWLLAAIIASLFAARSLLPILRPLTFLARSADRPAIDWIAANLPPGEPLLINPTPWGYGLYQGNDGGFWIAPLAGHPTLPPPVLYGLDNNRERLLSMNARIQQVIDAASDPPRLHDLLLEIGIRYIYIGARGGVLSAHRLMESGLFISIYQAQGTTLLQIP
jgi:hypothetical protein